MSEPSVTGDLFDSFRTKYDDGTYPAGFWEWINDNWHVFKAFVRLAKRGQRRGLRNWSARAVCHVLRWQTEIREKGQVELKINNNATPGMARLAMEMHPELKGFFRTRTPPGRCVIEFERVDG